MKINMKDIVCDNTVYPRVNFSWQQAYDYTEQMRAGAKFPAIHVGYLKDKPHPPYIVVDGWNRFEATKYLKKETIEATEQEYKNKFEMLMDSAARNVRHGRRLSVIDRARLVKMFKLKGLTKEQISSTLDIPKDKIGFFEARAYETKSGEVKPITSLVIDGLETQNVDESDYPEYAKKIPQEGFTVKSVKSLFNQAITFIKSNAFPHEDPEILKLCSELHMLLEQYL